MELFGRQNEVAKLQALAKNRRSFMLHGPMGVGKTRLLDELSTALSPSVRLSSSTVQHLFQDLAVSLWTQKFGSVRKRFRDLEQLRAKTSVSLKGICMQGLRETNCAIVLEHVGFGSHQMATAVKQLAFETGAPLVFACRSAHMEDGGYLVRLFVDRSDKFEVRNFEPHTAREFAIAFAQEAGLHAGNREDFLARVVELSDGNPGAIVTMVRMGCTSKYRMGDLIKATPLYIDYRLATAPTV